MNIYKLIHPDTAENEYRVELDINVIVTPPDPDNDVSDWDFYGTTELVDFEIISVQKRTCVQKSNTNPTGLDSSGVPRRKTDVLTYKSPNPSESSYNWEDVQMEDLPTEEREELINEINREVENECNY